MKVTRELTISSLVPRIEQRGQRAKSGSVCLVPSSSSNRVYRVEVDPDYSPVSCNCKGGKFLCMHKEAVIRYFAPRLARLLNSKINPVYGFVRGGVMVEARLSQFSVAEKQALREQQAADAARKQAEAARRARYNSLFDPNGIELAMYA